MPTERINFLGLEFDRLTFATVTRRLALVTARTPFSYVVTPNVDHIVMVDRDPTLRSLYDRAALSLCDSRILQRLARLVAIRLPLTPGSDLTRRLFRDVLREGDRIAVVGGDEHTLDGLRAQHPAITFLHHIPPMGLRTDRSARQEAASFIASAQARFTFLAVGTPQQEMIAADTLAHGGATGMGLCIGASLEFMTGQQKRAPRWIQRLGMEWAHRLALNPSRLWRRYLVNDMKIFPIFLRSLKFRHWLKAVVVVTAVAAMACVAVYAWPTRTAEPSRPSPTRIQRPTMAATQIALVLPPPDLIKPLTPEEAAEQNAERPVVKRPDRPASAFSLKPGAPGNAQALTCLTQAVYYEAASEGVDGGRAVAQIVLNRMRHPAFPASVCAVVYQGSERATGCQFSFTCDGSLARLPVPSIWARSRKIAEDALAGKVFAPVGHATHYHADYVVPYWADSLDKVAQIGRHIFYRLRGALGDGRRFSQPYDGIELGPLAIPPVATDAEPLAQAQIKGMGELIAEDTAREAAPPVRVPATPTNRPIADTASGTLIESGGPAPRPATRRKEVACSSAGEIQQVRPLQPVQMGSTASVQGGC